MQRAAIAYLKQLCGRHAHKHCPAQGLSCGFTGADTCFYKLRLSVWLAWPLYASGPVFAQLEFQVLAQILLIVERESSCKTAGFFSQS
jgi:hypothetical protein